MNDQTVQRAESLDKKDPLSSFGLEFEIPKDATGNKLIYLCGNSLGLQPKQTKDYINQELDHWAQWVWMDTLKGTMRGCPITNS